ncbi:MAG: HAMP domain-containing protein [Spirochaetales bacterium]|nr:HAMP domain-containing protein [Spirochaetales bacterium]MCF7938016.1 HAMP domain-containing protein [Spirochaetales bacterium]
MKLFYKTFLSFLVLILFQAIGTVVLVSNIVERNNQEDARIELKQDAVFSQEIINGWKRSMWKTMISIQQNKAIAGLIEADAGYMFSEKALEAVQQGVFTSGFDYFLVSRGSLSRVFANHNFQHSVYPPEILESTKEYANITYRFHEGLLSLVGSFSIGEYDLFIVKTLDAVFCSEIADKIDAEIVIFSTKYQLTGSRRFENNGKILELGNIDISYREYQNVELSQVQHDVAVHKLTDVDIGGTQQKVYLATILSKSKYIDRIAMINKIAFAVTLFTAVFSVLISLLISRNLILPVKRLVGAMLTIKGGNYSVSIDYQSKNEFGKLIDGFNNMSQKLQEDKKTMEQYITEITHLKDYNERIIQSLQASITIIGADYRIKLVNDLFVREFAEDKYTRGELLNRNIGELDLEIFNKEIVEGIGMLLNGSEQVFFRRRRMKNERLFEFKLYSLIQGENGQSNIQECVVIAEDITAKVDFENKIYQAEKISSISMLSAGVAHEINNPLSSIITNAQNLIEAEQQPDRLLSLRYIDQESKRIAGIVRNLLDFSCTDSDETSSCNVNGVIEEVVRLVNFSLNKNDDVFIDLDLDSNSPLCNISKDEFGQILINLLRNAIHAVSGSGKITVRSEYDLKNGYVQISVQDSGVGIPESIRSHVFDPFFTTKPNGVGTGLGLSVVYGIIKKYEGKIQIESEEGAGTVVQMMLPARQRVEYGFTRSEDSGAIDSGAVNV